MELQLDSKASLFRSQTQIFLGRTKLPYIMLHVCRKFFRLQNALPFCGTLKGLKYDY